MAGERIRLDEASSMEKAPKSEAEEKGREIAPVVVKDPPATITARKQNLPIWRRREEFLRQRGTTPRNLYDNDVFKINAPPSVKKNVRFWWASEPFWRTRPVCPGFRYDIWEPVTREVAEEMGIEVVGTKDFTPEGVYKAGHDAFLMWAPESIAKEYDEIVARGADAKTLMRAAEEDLNEKLTGDNSRPVGSILVTNSEQELEEAQVRERQDVMAPLE